MTQKCWVTMSDTFLSGWGPAKNKVSKLVIECDDVYEAAVVYRNAKRRGEMKYVNIRYTKPYYTNSTVVEYADKITYGSWFTDHPEWSEE